MFVKSTLPALILLVSLCLKIDGELVSISPPYFPPRCRWVCYPPTLSLPDGNSGTTLSGETTETTPGEPDTTTIIEDERSHKGIHRSHHLKQHASNKHHENKQHHHEKEYKVHSIHHDKQHEQKNRDNHHHQDKQHDFHQRVSEGKLICILPPYFQRCCRLVCYPPTLSLTDGNSETTLSGETTETTPGEQETTTIIEDERSHKGIHRSHHLKQHASNKHHENKHHHHEKEYKVHSIHHDKQHEQKNSDNHHHQDKQHDFHQRVNAHHERQ